MAKTKTAEITPEEKEGRINALRELLKRTESAAVEAADGIISAADYATTRAQRQAWRKELDALESTQTLDEIRKAKRAELRVACETVITAGVDVGGKHYSLSEHDQIELLAQTLAAKAGAAEVPYHADGELCQVMTAQDFMTVADAANAHIFYHRTYCNHLNVWVDRVCDVTDKYFDSVELNGISYGAILPDDLAAHMANILEAAGGAK